MATLARKLMNAPASAGIEFVGGAIAERPESTSGTTTLSLTSLTGGIAAAAASGDLIIAAFGASTPSDQSLSITDGTTAYTSVADLYSDDTRDINLQVSYKFSTGDTATTFGPTGGSVSSGVMAVYVFRGVNVSTPLDVTTTTATALDTMIPNPPSITPVTAGAYPVVIGASGHRASASSSFTSSDLTDFLTATGDSNDRTTLGIGHKPDWTSGAFDPAAFGLVTGADNQAYSWAAATMALRPA